MRRALLPLALAVALALTGCGGDKAAKKATGSKPTASASAPTDLPTGLPTGLPTELPTSLPTDLPTGLPTDLPTSLPTDLPSQASGGALDGCAVVTPALIASTFGGAAAGSPLGQPSSFGDPDARDCYYVGGDVTLVIQTTTRADQDMPADSYSYAGLPGSDPIKGADRGWVYTFPGQDGQDTIVSGIILVKGQDGLNLSITVGGHPYGNAELQQLAAAMLAAL